MPDTESNDITIKEIVVKIREWCRLLKAKWILIISMALLFGTLGFIYSSIKKPLYTASLSFVLEDDKSGGSGGLMSFASQFGFDIGGSAGGAFSSANLFGLMQSRTLIQESLLKPVHVGKNPISLAELFIQFNNYRVIWEKDEKIKAIQFPPDVELENLTYTQDSILSSFCKTISSKILTVSQRDKKSSIIYIDVKSKNELFSKYFAEALAVVVSDFYIKTKTKKSAQNLSILQFQTDSIRTELNNSLAGVAQANDNVFNLNPALNSKRLPSSRKQIDVQENTAILTQLVQNLEMAKLAVRKETPLIQIIDRPQLPLDETRLSKKMAVFLGLLFGSFIAIAFISIRRFFQTMDLGNA